jgi:hypothetical protein
VGQETHVVGVRPLASQRDHVIEPSVDDPVEESVRLFEASACSPDIVVVTEHEVEEWRAVRGSLIHAALAEGHIVSA